MTAATADDAPTQVPVILGDRSYDILIGTGLIESAGETIAARYPGRAVAVVTDAHVGAIHAEALEAGLAGAGIRHQRITVPPGEATKRFAMLEQVVDEILAARMERGDIVLALGGGVVGDLAGFAAAIVRRGMGFIQMPTSLLAQVDSSVGGKTGINTRHGKNLVGAFYQPGLVLADTDALDTLSTREFRAGYAEVAKYGLIDDPAFFGWLEQNWRGVFQGGRDRVHAIAVSCRAKAAVVARDETETGDRALLNLGHTFGHALESATGYDGSRLVHGEGVAIGMAQAFRFSAKLGLCAADDAARMAAHLTTVGLPTELAHIPGGVGDVDRLMTAIGQDKKVSRGALTFILARGIGQSFIARDVDPVAVRAFLTEELARI
ncbi:3-dehydroquinate synthase [Phreatobacter aquaticus]|uniref:3-dehydroquinate synthase n=1 Tax=Phreatobacter aquaticus TaxID=2570229 RepID=A0A4D7QH66_9HYPH|nr:3-dehydroquinate synthase [Phreatobacter aquaticus]QCK84796.1 3-dehydroquinate synthase [Phreatobacter aquaticus]